MRAAGLANIGITIEEYMKDCWAGLENGDEEILIGPIKQRFAHLEDERKAAFKDFVSVTADQGPKVELLNNEIRPTGDQSYSGIPQRCISG
ncbi:hypothetical protein NPX13_g2902 [Xylaria arbuscula]|uniref:Uncharacterized protein n=1 Tax=Xylaria arbuscula TaxID=114810 RepID=A0A9W8NIT0_9PEZI|nr:hypothetical protein NPX13_g2902 [Xylaria arbuscula]